METIHFPPGQNFDCGQCSKCCRGWRISVDEKTAANLRGKELALRIVLDSGQQALERRNGRSYMAKTNDGRCVFLDGQNLCSIHGEMGAESKPQGCRLFPFRLCRTPDGVYGGVSFFCSAVQANEGRPLEAHTEGLEEFTHDLPLVGHEPLAVEGSVTMDWPAYRVLDEFLASTLHSQPVEIALGRPLWALCQLVGKAGKRSLVIDTRALEAALEESRDSLMPPNEPFVLMERFHFCGIVTRCEAPSEKAQEKFAAALTSNRTLTYGRFQGWSGKLSEIRAAGADFPEGELRRYLQALVFRKFLVARRPVLHNLSLLFLVPSLFQFWCGLSRLGRGGSSVEPVDVRRAFDECECRMLTHARDIDEGLDLMARDFVEQMDY